MSQWTNSHNYASQVKLFILLSDGSDMLVRGGFSDGLINELLVLKKWKEQLGISDIIGGDDLLKEEMYKK